MQEQRLFRLAVEVLNLQCRYEVGQGWSVRCTTRRQGESFADGTDEMYSHLTTEELVDTIESVVGAALLLA